MERLPCEGSYDLEQYYSAYAQQSYSTCQVVYKNFQPKKAMVVKDKYKPEYQFAANAGGNHTFRVTPDSENRFEYMLFEAWSDGAVFNNHKIFPGTSLRIPDSFQILSRFYPDSYCLFV